MATNLTTSLRLGEVSLRSRLWCGAMFGTVREAGALPGVVAGAAEGLTAVVGVRGVVAAEGLSAPGEVLLENDGGISAVRELASAARGGGAALCVELTHGGPRSGDWIRARPVGPIATTDPCCGRTARPLSADERQTLPRLFAEAGRRAVAGGASLLGLEVADGSLLHAFLSPRTCPGDDAVEERLQPAVAALRSLRAMAPVVVTLCADDLSPGGISATTGVQAARVLATAGASALVVVAGGRRARHLRRPRRPPGPLREGTHLRIGAWVQRTAAIPVGTAGGWRARHAMDGALRAGLVDFLVLERPFLCEPDLGRRLASQGGASRCTSGWDCLRIAARQPTRVDCPATCPRMVRPLPRPPWRE